MEIFATLLCMFSMMAGIIFLIGLIVHKIRRKAKNKIYFRGLLISIIVFIASIILFAIFETPESKARYEQQRIERQKEKEAQALAEEQKAEEQKAEAKKAEEQEAEEQEVEEQKTKVQEEKQTEEKQDKQEQTNEKSQDKENNEEVKVSTEEVLKNEIEKVVEEERIELFNYVPDNNYALIKFKGGDNITSNMTVKGMYMDISNILKEIQNDVDVNVDINVTYPLQDAYGNVSDYTVIKATFNNETIKKINFENFNYNDIPSIADEWWNHNALN